MNVSQSGIEIENDQKLRAEPAPVEGAVTGSVLDALKCNLDKLEELHSRLQFMLGEIKILIRK